jgi:hypothetical protein
VVFSLSVLWLAKMSFLLLLAVMASQERSSKRRHSETRAVCVSSPSGASSVVEVLVPPSCSTRRSSTSSKQVSTSSKQVSGASPAALLSVGKRDLTVVRPPLAKLVSSENRRRWGEVLFHLRSPSCAGRPILLREGAVIRELPWTSASAVVSMSSFQQASG